MLLKVREIDEKNITRAIIRRAMEDWLNLTENDVIVVGAGPSGLSAAMYTAKAGLKQLCLRGDYLLVGAWAAVGCSSIRLSWNPRQTRS